jgi:CRP/FNR family transcriptional regulator, cyclic AMP receptor protein
MELDAKKLLRQQTLFCASSDDILAWASKMIRFTEYKSGDHICLQGDPQSPLVLMTSGQLRVSAMSEGGVELPIGVVNPGQSAGETSIIQRMPSPVNIRVVRRSIVGLFNRADARQLFNEANILRALTTKMAFQLREFYERQASQGVSRADARISAVIESAVSTANRDEFAPLEFPNQETIAAMAKVSRETVSRVMKSLELRGVIAREGRQIRVRDRVTLHQLATGSAESACHQSLTPRRSAASYARPGKQSLVGIGAGGPSIGAGRQSPAASTP